MTTRPEAEMEALFREDRRIVDAMMTEARTTGETPLFFGVGDQWKLLYVLEILVECCGGGGTEEALGSTFARCLHKPRVRTPFL